jgi:protein-tyrosine phosphatase
MTVAGGSDSPVPGIGGRPPATAGAVREDGIVPVYRVCFVCSGNICRSPTAEVVFRRLVEEAGLADAVHVDSAGMGDWHTGADADERAVAALRRRGYAVGRHCARQIEAADLERNDLVVALDSDHARSLRRMAPDARTAGKVRLLRSFDPAADGHLDVPDPYYGGQHAFDHVLDLIEEGCRGLLGELRGALAAHVRN